jgi:signal transduction histidine kinase
MRGTGLSRARSERRIVLLLPVLFAITIGSFVLATTIAQRRAGEIAGDAHSVSALAAPSIYHLSSARTELRRLQVLLHQYVDRAVRHVDSSDLEKKVERSREALDRAWAAYTALSPYPGERELFSRATEARRRESAAVDKLIRQIRDGDVRGAQTGLDQEIRPRVAEVDARLLEATDLNVRTAAELASRIEAAAGSARSLAITLNLVSAALAVLAGVVVAWATTKHLRALSAQVSELEHFAGRVAHDIRSPLASVALTLDVARMEGADDERVRAGLTRGRKTLERVGQLVDGLLVFAVAGGRPPSNTHVSVAGLVASVVEEFMPVATEKQIELRVERVDSTEVACSSGVLLSLLSNLVGNAIKYMGAAPVREVGVRAISTNAFVRFEVQDTGPGVPFELRGKIFDPYVRAAAAGGQGFGLGLATVRRLAEGHGGQAGMEPRDPGSLFWFVLPKPPRTS